MTEAEKKLQEMEIKLEGIYRRALKETGEQWESYLTKVNAEIIAAEKKYKDAKGGEEEKKYKNELERLKKQKTFLDGRYKALTEQTAERISKVNEIAAAYINGELPDVFSIGHNSIVEEAGDYVKGYGFDMVDADTVKRLSTEDKTLMPYKEIDGKKDVRWNVQKLNSEVLQGILQGESMPEIAKRFSTVMGMNETSAVRNARTSFTAAENSGRFDGMKRLAEKGVPMKKRWIAARDSHTRDAHLEMDGQERELDEPFESELGEIMFPGDPDADPANVYNCRCTMRTVIDLDALDKQSETAK